MEGGARSATVFPVMSNLDTVSGFLQEGASLKIILMALRNLTEPERQYLYDHIRVSSEDELLALLKLRTKQQQQQHFRGQVMEQAEEQLRQRLLLYVPLVLLVLGTAGNLLSFLVLRRRAMTQVSSYHYLACLAVADTLVLYSGLLRLWLQQVTGRDPQDVGDWACKLTTVVGYTASDLSVWLIIAVTVERYIVVCRPLRASAMISTRRAKRVIAVLALLMLAVNLHFIWTVQLVPTSDPDLDPDLDPRPGSNASASSRGNCEAARQHRRLVNEVWPWVDAFIYSFLPFLVIVVLNSCIVRHVLTARRQRRQLQNTGGRQQAFSLATPVLHRAVYSPVRDYGSPAHHHHHHHHAPPPSPCHDHDHTVPPLTAPLTKGRTAVTAAEGTKLTVMLLTVSFAFLLTTLPMNVTLIVTAFWNQRQHAPQPTARFQLAKTVAELLMYVNHSANFGLYCATGHKFRQQIAQLLRCRRARRAPAWSSVMTENSRLSAPVRSRLARPVQRLLMIRLAEDVDSNEDAVKTNV